jgi:hypothetical protein
MLLLDSSVCGLFKWRQFEPEVILLAVGWYLRFSLSFWGAWRTIAGYEAIHMIRKGQAYGSAAGAKVALLHSSIVGMLGIEV